MGQKEGTEKTLAEESLKDGLKISKTDIEMIKAMEHPKYKRLFKLLSMTKDLDMVKSRALQEGLNPVIFEQDGNVLIPLHDEKSIEKDKEDQVTNKNQIKTASNDGPMKLDQKNELNKTQLSKYGIKSTWTSSCHRPYNDEKYHLTKFPTYNIFATLYLSNTAPNKRGSINIDDNDNKLTSTSPNEEDISNIDDNLSTSDSSTLSEEAAIREEE